MANGTTRRQFLIKAASVAAVGVPLVSLLSGCATTGLVSYRRVMRDRRVALTVAEHPELMETGGAIELDVESFPDPIIVVRKNETEFLALSPICTHLGCTVRKESLFFRCPCHGSTYSLDGKVVRGPAERPLAAYMTELVDHRLIIHF